MKSLLSIFMPPRCPVCGKLTADENELCPDCRGSLERIKGPRCRICGAPLGSEFAMPECSDCRAGVPYDKCFAPYLYKDGARRTVIRMKFFSHPASCRFAAREIAAELGELRPDFITFVPQSAAARRKRGYNQTELIAKELGRLLGVGVRPTLERVENGENQVGLGYARRLENARRLYRATDSRLGGSCLIVDDVITTGATMKACCKLLRKMGCDRVYAAAFAKTEKFLKH